MPKTKLPRLTSIGITARLDGSHRVAVFPRDPFDFSTMPQDFRTEAEAQRYATALSTPTGWHVVDRTGAGRMKVHNARAAGPLPSTTISLTEFFSRARAREGKAGAELITVLGSGPLHGGLSSSSHPPRLRTAATQITRICNSDHGHRP